MPSDELLVRRYLRGDVFAFEQLVERYTPALFNLAYRLTQDRGEAEHVVQETFIRAWRYLDTFDGRAPLSAWLHRIAHPRSRKQRFGPRGVTGQPRRFHGCSHHSRLQRMRIARHAAAHPPFSRVPKRQQQRQSGRRPARDTFANNQIRRPCR